MPIAHDALQQLARRHPRALEMQRPQVCECVDDGVILGQRVGRNPAHVPAPLVLHMEDEEIVVAAAEEW